jgi:hypothetical protein
MKKSTILLLSILLASQTLAFEFCDEGETDTSSLRVISIDDMMLENSKEWEWEPGMKVELEARIENRDDESENFVLEIVFVENEDDEDITTKDDDLKQEFTLSANERKTLTIEFEIDDDADLNEYQIYAKLYEDGEEDKRCVENSEEYILLDKIELCEDGNVDTDELKISSITDEEKDNEEEWTWETGDEIEITVELHNYDYDERNFVTELILLDEDNEEVQLAEDDSDIIKTQEIDEDDSEEYTFTFRLNSNLNKGEYTLYAKSYDEDDENDICTSQKAESKSNPITIEIEKDKHNVIPTKATGPISAKTGENIEYQVRIKNQGEEDEDKVLIIAYNYYLGLKQEIEIENLKSNEETTVNFTLPIPTNATAQQYKISFSTEFEYNENKNYYKTASDGNDDIKKTITIITAQKEEEIIDENKTEEIEEIIDENKTIEVETIEQEENTTTTITGNVVGSSGNPSSIWAITIIAILAISGTYLFLNKKKTFAKKIKASPEPKIARRYTAKLN